MMIIVQFSRDKTKQRNSLIQLLFEFNASLLLSFELNCREKKTREKNFPLFFFQTRTKREREEKKRNHRYKNRNPQEDPLAISCFAKHFLRELLVVHLTMMSKFVVPLLMTILCLVITMAEEEKVSSIVFLLHFDFLSI